MKKFQWPWQKKKKEVPAPSGKRGYSAAAFNRLVNEWRAATSTADAEMRGPLKVLRNRSRDLGRNNDYVRQFFREVQNNVVGTGIPFQSQIKMKRGGDLNKTLNKEIEDLWYEWCKKGSCHTAGDLHFNDIERLAIREVAESGEFFIRLVMRKFGNSKIPFALELLEADMIDDDYNGISEAGNDIVMGVEKDIWGRRVAYYIKPKHPGDNGTGKAANYNSRSHIRVPAEEIVSLGMIERWPQTRSVPWIVSSILRLHHMGGYEEAEVIAARASASLMGFIQSDQGEIRADDVQDQDRVTEFEPGVFKYLAPGETVNIPNMNRPSGQLNPFMSFMLKGVAAGLGVSYSTISKDHSNDSYSSGRLSLISERDSWKSIQGWMIRNFHQVIFEKWLTMAVLSGAINLEGYELHPEKYNQVKWMPRGWAWVDPQKEVNAYKEALRGGLTTYSKLYAELGEDLEEMFNQRKLENDMIKKLDLTFDTDPTINRYGQGNTNSTSKNSSQDADNVDA